MAIATKRKRLAGFEGWWKPRKGIKRRSGWKILRPPDDPRECLFLGILAACVLLRRKFPDVDENIEWWSQLMPGAWENDDLIADCRLVFNAVGEMRPLQKVGGFPLTKKELDAVFRIADYIKQNAGGFPKE